MKRAPLVILPGWRLTSQSFLPLEQVLTKNGYKVFTVDFPGFDKNKPLLRPLKLSDYSKFLKEYLNKNHIVKPILIAHSFGGRVALKLLSEDPHLARALVLCGTPGFPNEPKFIISTKKTFIKILSIILSVYPLCLVKELLRSHFLKFIGAQDAGNVSGAIKETFNNVVEEKLEQFMSQVAVRTLLLWGADDTLVKVSIAKKMQKIIFGSKLQVVSGARHNFIYKKPDIFYSYLKPFLDNNAN